MSDFAENNDKLIKEVQDVVADTEALLAETAEGGSERAKELRKRLREKLHQAKECLQEAEKNMVAKAKTAAKATDQYVQENPWKSIGIAAGLAFLLGMLVSRR